MTRAGVARHVIMAIVRLKSEPVYRRYSILETEDLGDGLARRPSMRKGYPHKTPRNSEGLAMEARGIEPRSEPRSEAALRA